MMAQLEFSLTDIADLSKPYETYQSFVKTAVEIFHSKLDQRILHHEKLKGHKIDHFSIDQAYIFKSRKRFDPFDISTWDKRDIVSKWIQACKRRRHDGVMELFCVITKDMVPESFRKTSHEFSNDLRHGLEKAYCGHQLPVSAKPRVESTKFEAIVLIVLFRYDLVATDLELFHNVQTLRDALLSSYTDAVTERLAKHVAEYLEDKELDSSVFKVVIGSSYADEGNRLVFDRMKCKTWMQHGLTERCTELSHSAKPRDHTLVALLAIPDDIVPKFLEGYEPKYPYEYVTQDLGLKIAAALERFADQENGGKLSGFDLEIDQGDELKKPWTLHHFASVVYLGYYDPSQEAQLNSESIDNSVDDTNTPPNTPLEAGSDTEIATDVQEVADPADSDNDVSPEGVGTTDCDDTANAPQESEDSESVLE